jgi:hypothetical protein
LEESAGKGAGNAVSFGGSTWDGADTDSGVGSGSTANAGKTHRSVDNETRIVTHFLILFLF